MMKIIFTEADMIWLDVQGGQKWDVEFLRRQLKICLNYSIEALLVHEHILGILAAQPGPNGRLSCLHSFKIFWPMKPPYTSKMFLINVAHFDVSKTYKIFIKTLQIFYRLRNIFNCVLPHWRHLTAGLLYNDFGRDRWKITIFLEQNSQNQLLKL